MEQINLKNKLIKYIKAFIEFDNWKKHRRLNDIHGRIEFEKMYALIAKNTYNLIAY